MADRQRTLTTPETGQKTGTSYDLVRLCLGERCPARKTFLVRWHVGRLVAGAWEESPRYGDKVYSGTAYDTLIAVGAGAAGQDSAIQDQVFADLQTAGSIGAGTQGDY